MSLNAATAHDRVEQLLALTERLTTMMRRETASFEAHRPQEALAGAAETARLANLYRHESLKVRKDPSLITGAAPALRQRLIAATREFDAALARHGRAVEAAKTVTEGLVKAIAEEVAGSRLAGAGYGPGARAADSNATSITLNRRA